MEDRLNFLRLLQQVAKSCQYELTDIATEVYLETIEPFGFKKGSEALRQFFKKEFKMPKPLDLIKMLSPRNDNKQLAAELAEKMVTAVGRKGYIWSGPGGYSPFGSWEESCLSYFGEDGPIALGIIQMMGGWLRFHEKHNTIDGNEKARLRNIIESKLDEKKSQEVMDSLESGERKLLNGF